MMQDKAEAIEVLLRQHHTQSLAQQVADRIGMAKPFPLDDLDRMGLDVLPSSFSTVTGLTISMLPLCDMGLTAPCEKFHGNR
jgi:hypothetical protein